MKNLFKLPMQIFLLIVIYLGVSLSVSADGFVPTLNENHRLTAPGVVDFGEALAIDGDTMLSSSRELNAQINEIYVFTRNNNTWTQQAILTPDAGDIFISKLALDGDTALVMGYDNANTQSYDTVVYVFVRNGTTWSLQTKLQPDDGPEDSFGLAVAVQDNTALVFSLDQGPDETSQAAVYAFVRSGSTWTQQDKFTAGDYLPDGFGHVSLDGDVAVVGVLHNYSNPGKVYIFNRVGSDWIEQQVLTPGDSAPGSWFGYTTAIDGDNILIGDTTHEAVYAFKYLSGSWTEQQKLTNVDFPAGSGYGNAVRMDGNGAIVGTYFNRRAFTYLYDGTTWQLQNRLLRSNNGYTQERWGFAVGLSGTTAIVGAQYGDTFAYVFDDALTPNVEDNLLVNGGFESDSNTDEIPDPWSRKNTVDDKRKCNEINQPPVAYSGECAYLLKVGSGLNRKLVQNIDLNQHLLGTGDRLKLTGFYNKQSAGDMLIWIYVTYSDQTQSQAKIKVTKTTSGYQPIPAVALTLMGTPARVRVVIDNKTTADKTWLDALSLQVVGSASALETLLLPQVIPLPESASSLTGK